ncbi:hypothetical protein C2845_PM05G19510 [Panicum miliaceum]|uniref:Ubiquitin-like protease family profile domain-containing protein n=1 Tax=Panicum miliaceum TaxID=4540 RepID=A0A3L6T418_PANMI|nr:hypothetical protein C2845_PM05G19510 [Panicum miliaceum]
MAQSSKKTPGKGSKKPQQPIKSSKQQPKKKGATSAWTQAKSMLDGFLDSEVMSLATIGSDRSYMVDYVSKAMKKYAKKKLIMAFISYCTIKKMVNSSSLEHVTKFLCHQQPPGNACGFYAIHHMMEAMELLSTNGVQSDDNRLDTDVLNGIREKIASFIMTQVTSEKGEFHSRNPGLNMT